MRSAAGGFVGYMNLLEGSTFNVITILATLGATTIALVGVVYARRALFPPRRRLAVICFGRAPLAQDTRGLADFEIRFRGELIEDPHFIAFCIQNPSRHAIATEHFDQGRPIEVLLGAHIVDILRVEPHSDAITPHIEFDQSAIYIGPDLLAAKSQVDFIALTSGLPELTHVNSFLIDTEVTRQDSNELDRRRASSQRLRILLVCLLLLIISAVGLVSGIIILAKEGS